MELFVVDGRQRFSRPESALVVFAGDVSDPCAVLDSTNVRPDAMQTAGARNAERLSR
jgi:hypothetical protein